MSQDNCCNHDHSNPRPSPARHDHGHAHDHEHGHDHHHDHDGHAHEHAQPALATEAIDAPLGELRWSSLRIDAMDCPTEERLLRDALGKVAAVEALEFNLMQRVLKVQHRFTELAPLQRLVAQLGMQAEPLDAASPPAKPADKPWWPLALAGVAALAAEACEWFGFGPVWLEVGLALLAIATAGLPTYRKGWIALKNRNLNINALMSIAVTGALLIGQWPEAAMVSVLFALAELIEAKSLDRARNAIRGLLDLAPQQATVQVDGQWREMPASEVHPDARVRVRPGERIALDGELLVGRSGVNQAPITGESLPVDKEPGDPLFAGTINGEGELEYRVTRAANDSTLARIIHAVEEAQGTRAPTQRFVDSFSRIYTPTVFVLALLTAVLPPLLMQGAWLDWVYRALVLLVIACPCALVISTPVTLVSGLAAAARRGVLVKGGVYLEMGRQLAWVALDKTGTLTEGRPQQTDYVPLREGRADEARALAASLAARSDHPVSQALARAAEADGIALHGVDDLAALPGRGVKGLIGGRLYHLGNHRLVEELGLCSSTLEARLDSLEREGKTAIVLLDAEGPMALFAVADGVRETSREAVTELHQLGVRTLMLTGDNPHTAAAIAAQVGIDEALGNLLPEDKLREVERRQQGSQRIGMVGDGINDAPALARADIGFAMGAAGTDTAIETAGVALMDDDLRKLPLFIRLSRRTHAVLVQNIVLALGIKALFLALTLAGMGTLWMAVFADMGASLLVVFNGLRLLRGAR
ncbi:heavy metal translocating P-type ATPase [Pseudomonas sp. zfem005]|uniref:heavy metal translocating P-type ATPase n=1 Tax=Pseudomonas sp. zfem005 TaxID=3078200 RepID=UPI002929EF61|nr:heavy metal translocating P-type ATPase [Pseudomonas sp. zfem005]MDU9414593.1 heavy metal translocating P-type ATPase [Pseudomonas sp. zfem005]